MPLYKGMRLHITRNVNKEAYPPWESEAVRALSERPRSASRIGPGEAGPLPALPRQCHKWPYLMQAAYKGKNPKPKGFCWRNLALPGGWQFQGPLGRLQGLKQAPAR